MVGSICKHSSIDPGGLPSLILELFDARKRILRLGTSFQHRCQDFLPLMVILISYLKSWTVCICPAKVDRLRSTDNESQGPVSKRQDHRR